MIVLTPAAVIAGAGMATLWFKFAVSLDLCLPVKLPLVFAPSILLAAIPTAWAMSKLEEQH
jgi:hypothetical protein